MAKSKTISRMLGEAADIPDPAQANAERVPAEEPTTMDYTNPSVEQLLELWNSGNHEAVALRVLDALDMYRDFLTLAFRIGEAGAMELGQLMDDLTAGEHSAHKYDRVPDTNLDLKSVQRPYSHDTGDAAGASE